MQGDISDTYSLRPDADTVKSTALSDFFIDLALDGNLRIWSGNTLKAQVNVGQTYGRIRVDFLMPDFNSGSNAIARIFFNDNKIGYTQFNWDHTDQNYIGLSARASNYVKMDNLVVIPFENMPNDNLDLTADGKVDMFDFSKFGSQWLQGYVTPMP